MARNTGGRVSRRQLTWLWILGAIAVVVALLYFEQIALLYVLATLSLTWLLLVVAHADLSHSQKSAAPLPADDSAALGSGIDQTSPTPKTTFGARTSKRR